MSQTQPIILDLQEFFVERDEMWRIDRAGATELALRVFKNFIRCSDTR